MVGPKNETQIRGDLEMKSFIKRGLFVASMASVVAMPAFAKGMTGLCEGADDKVIENVKSKKECEAQGGKFSKAKRHEGKVAKGHAASKPVEVKKPDVAPAVDSVPQIEHK